MSVIFTALMGGSVLAVNPYLLPDNPLDDEGYLKIEIGDYVRATGKMETEFFEGRQLMADSVVKLAD